jgi:hypothetical protein
MTKKRFAKLKIEYDKMEINQPNEIILGGNNLVWLAVKQE